VKKNNRLGRGLGALIPEADGGTPEKEHTNLNEIEVALIRANPYQPRLSFDKTALEELKESISQKGIIQPITVRRADGFYELIAGERRLRAIIELGFEKVPAYILQVETKEEMLELALIENVQREKLNPIEQATAFQRLIDECNLTQDEVAKKIGKDRTTITNTIRLLKLPEMIQQSVQRDEISMGHARALLALEHESDQIVLWQKTIKNALSVRKVEKLVKELSEIGPDEEKDEKVRPRRSVFVQKAEDELREVFGTKVTIRPRKEGGVIEMEFYSPEDFTRLLEILEKVR
jgi:ParB family chromosome partitioning protein